MNEKKESEEIEMERLIFLDLESLPAGSPIDPMSLKPPGQMKKAETIAEWYKNDAPALAEEQWRRGALDSMKGEILCIGWSCEDREGVECGANELETMTLFESVVSDIMGRYKQIPTFVGWNIDAFDVPFLWRRAIRYGIKPLRDAFNRNRYKGNSIDLMTVWQADFKDYRKLSDVAAFLGIEDKSNGIDGSMVYDLYKEGRIEEIKEYCKADVQTVREIYDRIFN